MKQPTVSIIVPVYGVEDYIEKSIQSLLDQTFTDFEAIIINDGTLDRSIDIAKSIVKDDPRFIFLNKENGGLSSARNLGIDHASGTYICFLDPDDYYEKDFLLESITLIKKDKLDIIVTGMNYVTTDGKILNQFIPSCQSYYTKKDYLLTKNSINFSACNKLYLTSIFEKERFMVGILSEDREIIPRLLFGRKIGCTNRALHNYVQRTGSIVHSFNPNYVPSFFTVIKKQKEFLQQNKLLPDEKAIYHAAYINEFFLRVALYLSTYSPNYQKDVKNLLSQIDKDIVNFKNIKRVYKHDPIKKYGMLIFLYSPTLFKFLKNLKDKFK